MGNGLEYINEFSRFDRMYPNREEPEEEDSGMSYIQNLLQPYGMSLPKPSRNIMFPETGWFGRHPGLTTAIENAFLGAASTKSGDTIGENISNVAQSVIGIPQMRQQIQMQRMQGPMAFAAQLEQMREGPMKRRYMQSQIDENVSQDRARTATATHQANQDRAAQYQIFPATKFGPGYRVDKLTNQAEPLQSETDLYNEDAAKATDNPSDYNELYYSIAVKNEKERQAAAGNPNWQPTEEFSLKHRTAWGKAGGPTPFERAQGSMAGSGDLSDRAKLIFSTSVESAKNERERIEKEIQTLSDVSSRNRSTIPRAERPRKLKELNEQKAQLEKDFPEYLKWALGIVGTGQEPPPFQDYLLFKQGQSPGQSTSPRNTPTPGQGKSKIAPPNIDPKNPLGIF